MRLKRVGAVEIFTVLVAAFFPGAVQAAIPPDERAALIALYNSTGGDNWTDRTNWRKSPGVFNDAGTECTWFGVFCTGDSSVRAIALSDNGLSGTIPAALGDLDSLVDLRLGVNQLTGTIPPEIGALANLQMFSAFSNQLTGAIPPALGTLSELENLLLANNQLTGTIPSQLGSLNNLLALDLGDNELTGSIPPQLGNLSSLRNLLLYSNELTGEIPPELGSLESLLEIQVHFNNLTGTLPPELGNLENLQIFSVSVNQLSGAIPPELGNLSEVLFFFVDNNQFTHLPPELGNLDKLIFLSANNNQITGSIPPQWGNMTAIQTLILDGNQYTGTVPVELAGLTNLRVLAMRDNDLTGEIPPELGTLTDLIELNLSNNELTGPVPAELGDLSELTRLWLRGNELSGALPPELAQLTSLVDSFGFDVDNNHLYTDDNALREFLNSKHSGGDWEESQTLQRFFAHFGDGGGLFSQAVLFSLNDALAATGEAVLRSDSGQDLVVDLNGQEVQGTQEVSIPSSGLLTLQTDGQGEVQAGSVELTTNRHVEGVVLFGGDFGLAGVGGSQDLVSAFVAPIQRNESLEINTGIAVMVPGEESASLDVVLRDDAGNSVATASEMVPAEGHTALFVTDFDWDGAVDFEDFTGTLWADSSQPVAATVLQTRPGEFVTLPVVEQQDPSEEPGEGLAAVASQELYFAHFADGLGALSSQILLFNPSEEESAAVQVTLRDNEGDPLTVDLAGDDVAGETELEIGPRSLQVLATDGEGDLKVGSVAVTSDQPLAGVIIFAGAAVGAAGVGNSEELPEGFVAPMETHQVSGINTGIAVMNLEEEEIDLEADLLGSNGQLLATHQLALPARGHLSMFVSEFAWDSDVDFTEFSGLLKIRSSGRTAATVIQMRPGQFATMPVAAKPAD